MLTAVNLLAILPYPEIDPVAISIGPLAVRWYGLAYVTGILLAWLLAERMVARPKLWPGNRAPMSKAALGDFIVWATAGIVVGGRLFYVLVYDIHRTLADPASVLRIWNGGMSFHGGLFGTVVAMVVFSRRQGIRTWSLIDTVAAVAPLGIFFGRLANFINGELWGRVSDVPWAMVFPTGGPDPRHPSQLYEAGLEGLFLFLALQLLAYRTHILKKPGKLAGTFACGYALARLLSEQFREPDANIGFLTGGWLTMGMLLSLPVLLVGIYAILTARALPGDGMFARDSGRADDRTEGNGR
nr:prolipoprotein diacylglyceryl transferase [uncultured Gellertiella sp.]